MRATKLSSAPSTGHAPSKVWYSMYSRAAVGARFLPSRTTCGAFNTFHCATELVHSSGDFRQRGEPRARILAALGVVRRRGRHAMRPFPGAGLHHAVEVRDWQRFRGRVAADLVEREQAVIAVERGVLQRLRHQRAGELLQFQREATDARRAVRRPSGLEQIEREDIAQEIENAVVGGEPFGAGARDRLLDQRAVVRRLGRPPVM